MADTKTCKRCNSEKPITEFYDRKMSRDGKQPFCKPCSKFLSAQYHREWRAANKEVSKERDRSRKLKGNFGLSEADYGWMLLRCGFVCQICGETEATNKGGVLCVDHNHKTGAVRGLLCNSCNKALGFFRDNPELLRRAASYIEEQSDGKA